MHAAVEVKVTNFLIEQLKVHLHACYLPKIISDEETQNFAIWVTFDIFIIIRTFNELLLFISNRLWKQKLNFIDFWQNKSSKLA